MSVIFLGLSAPNINCHSKIRFKHICFVRPERHGFPSLPTYRTFTLYALAGVAGVPCGQS